MNGILIVLCEEFHFTDSQVANFMSLKNTREMCQDRYDKSHIALFTYITFFIILFLVFVPTVWAIQVGQYAHMVW